MNEENGENLPQQDDTNKGGAERPAAQEPAPVDPAAELEALRAELAGAKDKLLRTLAEMENLRRRTEKEVADAKLYGVTSFARESLALADNLRRAIEAFPAKAKEELEPHVAALIEGVELTERDFLSRLARFGVKKMEASDNRFDPNKHEALYEIPDESQPAGTVAQWVEPGYMIGERVLRPAKVGVTKGGPKG
ncbi:nucleotide exchange factor GrpE [Methylocystis bryophila]|uniref:Protein GrpE n=1 Tax=Methylocystis bryophila TaxID=655015 RepID=A0A1W6MUX8_9HYPH|nr:nucleotide exchange factor GrpE [Methylocystis bryophila]ARN81289.1 nucleotide exchange factor GrpE [Methylocystis bryophila]BDV37252.1 protein GrpE [Methylocystis bryophila]